MAAGGAYLVYKYRLRVSQYCIYSCELCTLSDEMIYQIPEDKKNKFESYMICLCYWHHPFSEGFKSRLILFLQSYMDSEIRAIMAQYMPLDSQSEVPHHANDNRL